MGRVAVILFVALSVFAAGSDGHLTLRRWNLT